MKKISLVRNFPSLSLIKEIFRVCRVSEISTVIKTPKDLSLPFTARPKELLTTDVHHGLMHFTAALHTLVCFKI